MVKFASSFRGWWPVGLLAVIGLIAGVAWAALTPKAYTATVTLFVGSAVSPDSSAAYNLDLFSQQRTLTYAKLTQNRDLAAKVVQDLGLGISPEALSAKISASPVPKTVLMKISATDGSAAGATDIANTFTNEFALYVTELETPGGADHPSSVVTVVQRAEPPTSSDSPSLALCGLAGLVGGFVAGLFVKWAIRFLDRRVKTAKQVEESTGTPVLGALPRGAARRKHRLNLDAERGSNYGEAVRKLRANLLYRDGDAMPRTIAFVSPKSTLATTATATNLAVVIEATGRHVALVDADMRKPRLAGYLGAADSAQATTSGLSSVLSGDVPLDKAMLRMRGTGIDMLLAGSPSKAVADSLATDALAKVFAELNSRHDFLFCDTPGIESAADAAEIGRVCDAVLLVVQQGKTRVDQLAEAAETLQRVGVNVIGAVLTDFR